MLVTIHFIISLVFFFIGFLMRYGLANSLAVYFHGKLPNLSKVDYEELVVRRFIGETSIKLGTMILMIALYGLLLPESFTQAIIIGWICFIILAIGSVSFFDKMNLVASYKRAKAAKKQSERDNQ